MLLQCNYALKTEEMAAGIHLCLEYIFKLKTVIVIIFHNVIVFTVFLIAVIIQIMK